MQYKAFLLHELDNVDAVLRDTLRHDYPPENSEGYYKECKFRIARLRDRINAITDADISAIEEYASRVSSVSYLISMIERSHLGEFSWSFAHRLQEIALAICKEDGPLGPVQPIIQILADGYIAPYRIHTERGWPSVLRERRILHIVFPRSNKHHVLLHSIFGHEICHAAYAIPKLQKEFKSKVVGPLFAGTPLATAGDAEAWFNKQNRPAEVSNFLTNVWDRLRPHPFTFVGKNQHALLNWQQELFCDLLGVMMFGPTFVGAMNTLLGSMRPRGESVADSHPPFACRANLLNRALSRLQFTNNPPSGNAKLDAARATAETFFTKRPSQDPWYELFTDKNIDDAIAGFRTVLAAAPQVLYVEPSKDHLEHVVDNLCRRVPPCGSRLHSRDPKPEPFALDFRHVLFGGWITWLGQSDLQPPKKLDFLSINRLCDLGILQQLAVERTR